MSPLFLYICIMKTIASIIALVATAFIFTAQAQTSQMKFEKTVPDSLLYMMPAFDNGRVTYTDGDFSTGRFNICTLDQTLRYLDGNGDVMVLADAASISRVNIGGILFYHYNDMYIKSVDTAGEIILGVNRKMIINDSKRGAYGSESQTTNITQVNRVDDTANGIVYSFAGDVKYKMQERPFLVLKNKVYEASKSSLSKCFPDKKDFIKSYLKEHKVHWNNVQEVKALFDLLKQ